MRGMVCVVLAGMIATGGAARAQQGAVTSGAGAAPSDASHAMVTSSPTGSQTATADTAAKIAGLEKQIAEMKAKLQDWPQLGRYREADMALPATQPGRVVFLGDSITDFWVQNGGSFFPGKPYVNRGISAQTTPQMLVRFQQDVVNLHPEAVVILAGTNDIAGNTGPAALGMIEDNLRSMTEIAKANGIRVILASVLPVKVYPWRTSVPDPPGKIEALNAWIKDYCAKQGCTYLDYWTAMAGPDGGMKPGISIDGVHPNGAGYAIMEPLAEKAITEK